MCKCCQSCIEDLMWGCFEEKYCYDEEIANYNPEEDEYYRKKTHNGFLMPNAENNNGPVTIQPAALDRHCPLASPKIHENEFHREVQTNVSVLAPEILSAFANSHIFHDHQPKTSVKSRLGTPRGTPLVHKKINLTDNQKLLDRLEGKQSSASPISQSSEDLSSVSGPNKISVLINEEDRSVSNKSSRQILAIQEEGDDDETDSDQPIQLRMKQPEKTFLKPRSMFDFRPVSENDIFTISRNFSSISMTPEVPAISFSALPKNYMDTPKFEEYRESVSLYSIQTAESARIIETDQLQMPRYYGKSDIIMQNQTRVMSAENLPTRSPKQVQKSKRLISMRQKLPPLMINESEEVENKTPTGKTPKKF